jgi:hypothetical protein
MASIIFIAPDFVFTDELVGKFMNDDKTKKVNAAMNDRHSKLSIKEAEIAKREFESALKNTKKGAYKKNVRVEKSLDNLYKNAEDLIKSNKIIIVAVPQTRKFFLEKVTPSGISRDTFLARLDKAGAKNKIKVRKYLLLFSYDINQVFDKDSFDKLSSNQDRRYIGKTETSEGYYSTVDKGDKSKFIIYDKNAKFEEAKVIEADTTGEKRLIKAPEGVSEFTGFQDVIKLEEEDDEELKISELIKFQKEAKSVSKILFTPTGNIVKDLKIAINNKLVIKVKYTGRVNYTGELATGVRIIEPVALGTSKIGISQNSLALRAWLKKGDTLSPENRPGWRFLYVSRIDSLEFTGDSFNYKRPSFNSTGDKWLKSIVAISSFDKTRIYGKGRRAEIETSLVVRLSLLIASPNATKRELITYIRKLKEVKENHESGAQVLGYKDRELLYKYFPQTR